ncbi:MAG: UPF0149 family protein [Gammaproteobacteria bacterium]|nr:UPF0149 family protein [Gammaproteobacteria bacterium]
MYENFDGEPGVFDFEEIANHMLEQGVESSPATVHGCLCGLLAAGASSEAEVCLDALDQALGLSVHGELAEQVMQLYTVTAAALLDDEFDFYPLLPDDEIDIVERTAEMAAWCKGFLAGFAHVSVGAEKNPPALSEDSGEILKDFAKISQAVIGDQDSEEELENSYMELVEYIRFAALNVFMDLVSDNPVAADTPPSIH